MDLAPDRASTFAEEVDLLFAFLTGLSGFMAFLIAFGLAYFGIRYRKSIVRCRRLRRTKWSSLGRSCR
jgi:hypothetical protein